MYFFKRENGKWVIGATAESEIIKVPCKLIKKTDTKISVSKIEDNSLLIDSIEVTDIKKNSVGDFYESYGDFKTGVTEFFDNRFMWDKTAVVNNESLAITNQFIAYGIGTSTIILPSAAVSDRRIIVKSINELDEDGTITVIPQSGATIDYLSSYELAALESIEVISHGGNWYIISKLN